MGRRARHLNARHAGAGLVLDARRLTGLNDGDAVSTWADASGNGWDATGSGTARPLYETAIQGGQPVLRFDGVNDLLSLSGTAAVGLYRNKSYGVAISVLVDSNSAAGDRYHQPFMNTVSGSNNARFTLLTRASWVAGLSTGGRRLDGDSLRESGSAGSSSSACVMSGLMDWGNNSQLARKNGVSGAAGTFSSGAGSTSNTDSLAMLIGAGNAGVNKFPGDMACLFLIGQSTALGLIRRLEHSAAFSFKIACS